MAKEKEKKEIKKSVSKKKDNRKKEPFLKGFKSEISKVKWPETKEVVKYAVATLVMCVFVGLFFQLLEFLSSLIKGLI